VLEGAIKNSNFLNYMKRNKRHLNKYVSLTIEERIDRIGAILASAIRLLLKKGVGQQKD